jgi:hypothetical protein
MSNNCCDGDNFERRVSYMLRTKPAGIEAGLKPIGACHSLLASRGARKKRGAEAEAGNPTCGEAEKAKGTAKHDLQIPVHMHRKEPSQ